MIDIHNYLCHHIVVERYIFPLNLIFRQVKCILCGKRWYF